MIRCRLPTRNQNGVTEGIPRKRAADLGVMTTTAIIARLIPTTLGVGIGGTGRAAIAVTIIGGQSLCLFLTLLLVPVAHVKCDAIEQAVVGHTAKAWLARVSAATVGRFRPAAESRQG